MPWKMFLIEPTRFARRSLRRFWNSSDKGPSDPAHYHDAEVVIEAEVDIGPGGHGQSTLGDDYAGDPRWPRTCACGYAFDDQDHRQMNESRLWAGSPDGKLYPLREGPPGSTWVCDWFPEEGPNGHWTGPDGKVWAVMMPGGIEWIIYSYASGDPKTKWDVQGTPPMITVSPSIHQARVRSST